MVARCPVAAIRPAVVNGRPSLEVDERKCVCCGACYPPCPPMQINDPEHSKLAIWVGGKNSNARTKPSFQKLVVSGLPNNPPRWPEVAKTVKKKILRCYQQDARDWGTAGRMGRANRLAAVFRATGSCRSRATTSTTGEVVEYAQPLDAYPFLNGTATATAGPFMRSAGAVAVRSDSSPRQTANHRPGSPGGRIGQRALASPLIRRYRQRIRYPPVACP